MEHVTLRVYRESAGPVENLVRQVLPAAMEALTPLNRCWPNW